MELGLKHPKAVQSRHASVLVHRYVNFQEISIYGKFELQVNIM